MIIILSSGHEECGAISAATRVVKQKNFYYKVIGMHMIKRYLVYL